MSIPLRRNSQNITADWFNSIADELEALEKVYDIVDSQSATALTDQSFDGENISSVVFDYEVQRSTTVFANGSFAMQYLNGTWRLADRGFTGEEHGLTFSIDQVDTIGDLEVAADNLGNGKLKIKRRTFGA